MRSQNTPAGILLLDKPEGITSHDAVYKARKALGIRKVGHAGTLDPMATGLLILLIGKGTKWFDRFAGLEKEYDVTMRLGQATDTGDREGTIVRECGIDRISEEDIRKVFADFTGDLEQVPPMYSSIKYNGERLYKLARQGKKVDLPPRPITIYENRVDRIALPEVDFTVRCSKGTYIRKLAEDIGEALGACAHITRLRRTRIGTYRVAEAVSIEGMEKRVIKNID